MHILANVEVAIDENKSQQAWQILHVPNRDDGQCHKFENESWSKYELIYLLYC